MRYATPCGLRAMLRATPALLCVTLLPLLPFSALADDDGLSHPPEAVTPVSAFVPPTATPVLSNGLMSTVASSVGARVQSAADLVVKSAQDVTGQAMDLIGVRYKFGGQTPEKGLDCSGLVKYVFEQVTGVAMPRSARDQAKVGEKVERDELQPGDLVFFNTRRAAYSHVGIYLGDNSFVHAPQKKSSVKVANMDGQYWRKRFDGARRLLGIMPGMVSIEAAKSLLQALPSSAGQDDDTK
jgi:cell wall-associated NlpC family hydrolase